MRKHLTPQQIARLLREDEEELLPDESNFISPYAVDRPLQNVVVHHKNGKRYEADYARVIDDILYLFKKPMKSKICQYGGNAIKQLRKFPEVYQLNNSSYAIKALHENVGVSVADYKYIPANLTAYGGPEGFKDKCLDIHRRAFVLNFDLLRRHLISHEIFGYIIDFNRLVRTIDDLAEGVLRELREGAAKDVDLHYVHSPLLGLQLNRILSDEIDPKHHSFFKAALSGRGQSFYTGTGECRHSLSNATWGSAHQHGSSYLFFEPPAGYGFYSTPVQAFAHRIHHIAPDSEKNGKLDQSYWDEVSRYTSTTYSATKSGRGRFFIMTKMPSADSKMHYKELGLVTNANADPKTHLASHQIDREDCDHATKCALWNSAYFERVNPVHDSRKFLQNAFLHSSPFITIANISAPTATLTMNLDNITSIELS